MEVTNFCGKLSRVLIQAAFCRENLNCKNFVDEIAAIFVFPPQKDICEFQIVD
jgi:hypothetical protein